MARALDREDVAASVLKPLGLPSEPVGSHLALSGQAAYADNSGALGKQDAKEARALLADAGWVPGGPVKEEKKDGKKDEGEKAAGSEADKDGDPEGSGDGDDGTYIVGEDDGKNHGDGKAPHDSGTGTGRLTQGGAPAGAYAPKGTAAPARADTAPVAKDGKALVLRFVLPSGPGSETLAGVADRISEMLKKIGIRTDVSKVDNDSYFKDHIASGAFDLALYSWPATAFPATDARPVYAKPVAAADGSLNVEQNWTRVGTDQVDQLFDQAVATLDDAERRDLIRKADSRIWAAAGSIPLYQRPELVAARENLANAGAFGFATPVYEDMGFLKKSAQGPAGTPGTKSAEESPRTEIARPYAPVRAVVAGARGGRGSRRCRGPYHGVRPRRVQPGRARPPELLVQGLPQHSGRYAFYGCVYNASRHPQRRHRRPRRPRQDHHRRRHAQAGRRLRRPPARPGRRPHDGLERPGA